MGEPPLQGFNLLAWILPFAALAGGGIFVWRRMRKMVVQKPQPAGVLTPAVEEKYHRQLEEELKRYG
jgi:cytochrome c-type biogenesis protein CcmH/NrfF